jgi:hypothetical protein
MSIPRFPTDPPDVPIPDPTSSPDDPTPDTGSGGSDTGGGLDDFELRNAIGSGSIQTNVDPDTGRATQTIASTGSSETNSTQGVATEGTVEVTTTDATSTVADLRETEQTIENVTDGAAFGNPNETETIDSNTTHTTAGGDASGGVSGSASGGVAGTGITAGVVVAVLFVLGAVGAVVGGD